MHHLPLFQSNHIHTNSYGRLCEQLFYALQAHKTIPSVCVCIEHTLEASKRIKQFQAHKTIVLCAWTLPDIIEHTLEASKRIKQLFYALQAHKTIPGA